MPKYTVEIPPSGVDSRSVSLPVEVSNCFYDGIMVTLYALDDLSKPIREPVFMKNPFREYVLVDNIKDAFELEIQFDSKGYYFHATAIGDSMNVPGLCVIVDYSEGWKL